MSRFVRVGGCLTGNHPAQRSAAVSFSHASSADASHLRREGKKKATRPITRAGLAPAPWMRDPPTLTFANQLPGFP
jgi:hypothetical protein